MNILRFASAVIMILLCSLAGTVRASDDVSSQTIKSYNVCFRQEAPEPASFDWGDGYWKDVAPLEINSFLKSGSDHRPRIQAKAVYTSDAIHVLYKAEDCFVRAVKTKRQEQVCEDSCLEFFVRPFRDKGYVNFEVNCGGTFLSKYYDPDLPIGIRLEKCVPLSDQVLDRVIVRSTMPAVVEPELTSPTTYMVRLSVPFAVLESVYGPLGQIHGAEWRGNFYKCADKTSHPHWATWSPIDPELCLHCPNKFVKLIFE